MSEELDRAVEEALDAYRAGVEDGRREANANTWAARLARAAGAPITPEELEVLRRAGWELEQLTGDVYHRLFEAVTQAGQARADREASRRR